MKNLLIYADKELSGQFAKLAHGILRYCPNVVGVIDSDHSTKTVENAIGVKNIHGLLIPCISSLDEATSLHPEVLVLGIAPRGGKLPNHWRSVICKAITLGLDIYSGMHTSLNTDPEFLSLAKKYRVRLWDARQVPEQLTIGMARTRKIPCKIVLTVGSDCAIGKMSVALELHHAAKAKGLRSLFIPTGQTAVIIAQFGYSIDRVIGDFMAGAVEELILNHYDNHDIIFVEGQGSLFHPGYSGVTLSLLHGTMPDYMIFCHHPKRTKIKDSNLDLPPLNDMISTYEHLTPQWKKGKVVGLALNLSDYIEPQLTSIISEYQHKTNLPVVDCFKMSCDPLLHAIGITYK